MYSLTFTTGCVTVLRNEGKASQMMKLFPPQSFHSNQALMQGCERLSPGVPSFNHGQWCSAPKMGWGWVRGLGCLYYLGGS